MQKPNILIDDEIFIRQRFGGVSRIFIEILKARQTFSEANILFNNCYSENEYLQAAGLSKLKPYFKHYQFPLKGKLTRFLVGNWSHAQTNRALASGKIQIFHPTFYSDYFFKSLNSDTKLVFTLHDLTHEKSNDSLSAIKKKNLERANHIIVVSQQTKTEMEEFYPFTKNKAVSIIHLAQNLPILAKTISNLPEQFLLFVGERSGYKNFDLLLNAFATLLKKHSQLCLVCCGGQNFNAKEKAEIESLGVASRTFHFKLSDAELKYAYQKAAVFVYPSLNEGFGIPTLEAMACQTPSILSDIPVFREVANDAALFFNPQNMLELAHKIDTVLSEDLVRTNLQNKAKQRALNFSWEQHLQKTFDVYKSLLR